MRNSSPTYRGGRILASLVKETYELGNLTGANNNENTRNIIKELIRQKGAVYIAFYATTAFHMLNSNNNAYFDNSMGTEINHCVCIVGWDDNFSRERFPENRRPNNNGAWLIRNSWGTAPWPQGVSWVDNGYCWMSYEQNIMSVTLFMAEETEEPLKHYGYDDLGRTSSYSDLNWAANIFKAESDEILKYVGFYTIAHNTNYRINVYDLGTTAPFSPTSGQLIASKNGYMQYSGYHTEEISGTVRLSKGHYFSVVVNASTGSAIESKQTPKQPVVVNNGESFFSYNGTTWAGMLSGFNANACIKAFTIKVVEITSGHFPDATFRSCIMSNFDKNNDGFLSEAEIKAATYLSISYSSITSLRGIEYLTNLTDLSVWRNDRLTQVDLSKNTALTRLTLWDNRLTALDVSKCPALTYLDVDNNKLTTINLGSKPALTKLYISNNQLTALDVSKCPALTYLDVINNKLKTINLGSKSALTRLYLYNNQLTGIDVSKCPALNYLDLNSNQLTAIDLSKNTALYSISLDNNKLKRVNLASNALTSLYLGNNLLTTLDVSKCPALTSLGLSNNQLTTIDLSKNTALNYLSIGSNYLTWLDLTKNRSGSYYMSSQHPRELKVSKSGSSYLVNLKNYVKDASKVRNVIGRDAHYHTINQTRAYNTSTGIATFASMPSNITYYYDTGQGGQYKSLYVTLITPIAVNTSSLSAARTGEPYSFALSVSGMSPEYTITTGSLPPGVWFDGYDGKFQGTPSKSGSYTFTLRAKNDLGSVTKRFILNVKPKIKTQAALPAAKFKTSYRQALALYGKDSNSNITWRLMGGKLPAGLTFNASTGIISGKPSETVKKNIKIRASLKNNSGLYDERTFNLKVTGVAPKITTTSLKNGKINSSYTASLRASGSTPINIKWKVSGLPKGLSLTASKTGVTASIKGKPSKSGNFTVKITVSNTEGSSSKTFKLKIIPSKPRITTAKLNAATINKSYSATIKATGEKLTYSMSWVGKSIKGLSFNKKKGTIKGTPRSSNTAGRYKIKFTAKNSAGSVSKTFVLTLREAAVVRKQGQEQNYHQTQPIVRIAQNQAPVNVNMTIMNHESENVVTLNHEEKFSFPHDVDFVDDKFYSGNIIKLDDKEYFIAAVLPSVTVNEPGQYDIEVILNDNTRTGAKLIWLACPVNAEDSEDDEIADFYDETGKYITEVPESKLITVSPWLRAGVIYEPLIAIEVEK